LAHASKSVLVPEDPNGLTAETPTIAEFLKKAGLNQLAARYPDTVIACTELIVNAELVDVILWVDDLTTILRAVPKSGTNASKTARNIIQMLGVRGHLQYRNLLFGESA
jgi:hypothetical protein